MLLSLAGACLGQSTQSADLPPESKTGTLSPTVRDEVNLKGRRTGPLVMRQARPAQGIDFSQQGLGRPQAAALARAFQELDLSEDQKEKIRGAWVAFTAQVRRLNALRRAKAVVFDDALSARDFNAADAEKKSADLAATEADILRNQMKIMIDIRQVLNQQQGARLFEILEEERLKARRAPPVNANPL